MRCSDCDTRLGDDPFIYRDRAFCCECMTALCSWFLDGGFVEEPDRYAEVFPGEVLV